MASPELPNTMIEAHVDENTNVTLHKVPIPTLTDPSQLLVKVMVSGTNPKDWKMPAGILKTISDCPNSGDDLAGYVVAVGRNVHDFKPGDRVAGLHQLGHPHGSYAEYAILWDFATFHLGNDVSFEEAAVYPMAIIMAAMGLFAKLKLQFQPWVAHDAQGPLLIYGASSSVGLMAVQLAKIAGIHPIIAVAGGGSPLVEKYLDKSKGDAIVDYREGDEAVVQGIKHALQGQKLLHAFDIVSEKGSHINISKVLDQEKGKITLVLVVKPEEIPEGIEKSVTMANTMWKPVNLRAGVSDDQSKIGEIGIRQGGHEFGLMFTRLMGKWIREGKLHARPYEVVPGGLKGVEQALKSLRAGDTGKKYVVRVQDTEEIANRTT